MNYFKDIQNLALWLAVDKTYINSQQVARLNIFYKKPIKRFFYQKDYIIYDPSLTINGTSKAMPSAKMLNLEDDYKPYKLYILKKRHKKSIRTFWLAVLGYKKYVLTNIFPIKNKQWSHTTTHKAVVLYINQHICEALWFNINNPFCKSCYNYNYCNKIANNNYFFYKKIYLYYIKNDEKVYL